MTLRDDLERDGFAVVQPCVDAETCARLMSHASELVADYEPPPERSIFTTHEQARTSDEYFLASGDRISFFFEEHDPQVVNKIGHALHDLDPVFAPFSRSPALASMCTALGMQDPLLVQSMYIFKNPGIGGEVTLHQDATFLYTEPVTVVGLWFALEDATVDNGCLWAVPGGHRFGLQRRFRRAAGGGTEFVDLADGAAPTTRPVAIEVPAGSLVVLHGLLPHRSDANMSPKSRHAYSLHVIERSASYPTDNWLQRGPEMPLRGFADVR
ncbi:MAG: phytanoyl-CoA dioxygenase family protein [Actinomycetota bacterium]